MTISVVQTASGTSFPISFTNPVTAGNTVVIVANVISTGTAPVLASPTLNGSSVAGSFPIWNDSGTQNAVFSTSNVASSAWVLPNCPNANGINFGTNNISYNAGIVAYEVSGLGTSPTVNAQNEGVAASGNISVTTPATTSSPVFVFGCVADNAAPSTNPAGFTYTSPTSNSWAGYIIDAASGNTYNWAQNSSGGTYSCGVACLVPSATLPPDTGRASTQTQISNSWVGSMAQRYALHLRRPPQSETVNLDPSEPASVRQAQPVRIPNPNVGPQALRNRFPRQPLSRSIIAYPATAKLTDTFDTLSATKWTNWGTASVANGQLVLPCDSAYDGGVQSTSLYDLTGSSISLQLLQVPGAGNGSTQTNFAIASPASPGNASHMFQYSGGTMTAIAVVSNVSNTLWSVPYDPYNHQFLRMREAGGIVYYDTSPDASTWINVASTASVFSVSAAYISLYTGYWGTESSPAPAIFDNLNLQPSWLAAPPTIISNPNVGPQAQRNAIHTRRPPQSETVNLDPSEPKQVRQAGPVIIPNQFVGPQALRNSFPRQPLRYTQNQQLGAAPFDGNFAGPVVLPNPNVGPQALRNKFQRKPQSQTQISAGPPYGSIAFDAVSGIGGGSIITGVTQTATWTHTCKGTVVVVSTIPDTAGAYTSSSATYGGQAMTSLGWLSYGGGNNLGQEMFYLLNPPSGPQTVSITVNQTSSASVGFYAASAVSYTNVGSVVGSTATGGSAPSQTVSSAPGEVIAQSFMQGNAAPTGYNQTTRWLSDGSSFGTFLVTGDAPGAASVTFTLTNNTNWEGSALRLIPNQAQTADASLTATITPFTTCPDGGLPQTAIVLPNPNVGPMALRNAFRRKPQSQYYATNPLAYDATGAGGTGGASLSWTHTASGASGSVVLVFVNAFGPNNYVTPGVSVTYDGVSMGAALVSESSQYNPSYGYMNNTTVFALANPPSGAKTVAVTITNAYAAGNYGNSVSYTGVGSVGTASGATAASGNGSQTVTSAAGEIVAQAFGGYNDGLSSYSQTERYNAGYLDIGDAPGAASVTFTATNTGFGWGSVAVRLAPPQAWTANSSLAVTANPTTTYADNGAPQTAIVLPNPNVGPQALRNAFQRKPQSQYYAPDSSAWAVTPTRPTFETSTGIGQTYAASVTTYTTTWTHPGGTPGRLIVVATCFIATGYGYGSSSASFRGSAMTSGVSEGYGGNPAAGSSYGVELFYFYDTVGAAGTVSITVNQAGASGYLGFMSATSLSYIGASSGVTAGTATGGSGGGTPSQTVSSGPGELVVQAFGTMPNANGYNQSLRWQEDNGVSRGYYLVVGDAPGDTSVVFSVATTSTQWAGVAIRLRFAAATADSSLAITATPTTAYADTGAPQAAIVLPNPNVGPMALRNAFRRKPQSQTQILVGPPVPYSQIIFEQSAGVGIVTTTGTDSYTVSWTHPAGAAGRVIVVTACTFAAYNGINGCTATFGGSSMTLVNLDLRVNAITNGMFYITDATGASGTVSITVTQANYGGAELGYALGVESATSLSYTGVGNVTTTGAGGVYAGSGTASQTVSSAPGELVVQSFVQGIQPAGYNQNTRWQANGSTTGMYLVAGDAPGSPSVTFTDTVSAYYFGSAVRLLPIWYADSALTVTATPSADSTHGFGSDSSLTVTASPSADSLRNANVDSSLALTGTASDTANYAALANVTETITATGTATDTRNQFSDTSLAGTATTTAATSFAALLDAAQATTATLSDTATRNVFSDSSLTGTATVSANELATWIVNTSLAGTATLTATDTRNLFADAPTAVTATLTGTDTRAQFAAVSLAVTATATDVVAWSALISASQVLTATLNSTATRNQFTDSSLAITVTESTVMYLSGLLNTSLSVTDTTSDTGTRNAIVNTSTAVTATITAAAFTQSTAQTADVSLSVTVTPTGTISWGASFATTLTGTAAPTSAGTRGQAIDTTPLTVTGTLTAVTSRGQLLDALLSASGTRAAAVSLSALLDALLPVTATASPLATYGVHCDAPLPITATTTDHAILAATAAATLAGTATLTVTNIRNQFINSISTTITASTAQAMRLDASALAALNVPVSLLVSLFERTGANFFGYFLA